LLEFSRSGCDKTVTKFCEVGRYLLVFDDRILLHHFGRTFAPELDILLRRELVLGKLQRRLS